MTARDSRGRFVSPDAAAAERVLQRAVEEAIGIFAALVVHDKYMACDQDCMADEDYWRAEQALLHAAHAAEPLLRGGAA